MKEFISHVKAHQYREAVQWDHTRHIMLMVAKAAGAKKIRSAKDVMEIPLIDKGQGNDARLERLVKRNEELKQSLALRKRMHEVNAQNNVANP